MTKPYFSYSKISTFIQCPKRYQFQYIQKLPTLPKPYFSFGSSIHNTLKEFHSNQAIISFDELQRIYRSEWITKTGYSSLTEEQEYYELGLEILKKYHLLQLNNYIQPILLEKRFQLEYDNFLLIGAIDRVDKDKSGRLEIIDYKTSKRMPTSFDLEKDLQLAVYGLAVKELLGEYPVSLSYFFLRFLKKRSFAPINGYFTKTSLKLNELVSNIFEAEKSLDFPAKQSKLCAYCDFYKNCPEGNKAIYLSKQNSFILPKVQPNPSFQEISKQIQNEAGEEEISGQIDFLQKHFPFSFFRPGQLEVILSVLHNNEVLAVMPTGAGKSLCYQMLSLQFEGLTVVISPLIALMKDQVEGIRELGFKRATFLNTSITLNQYRHRISKILNGEVSLIYLAPESLRNRNIVRILEQVGISLLVIDEAHCISQWGHDFRPDYLAIKALRKRWLNCKVLAMTATATPDVQKDIIKQLSSGKMVSLIMDSDRPNLFLEVYHVFSDIEKLNLLQQLMSELKGAGIIYVNTRKHAEELAATLSSWGFAIHHYHAGIPRRQRSVIQDKFMSGELPLVVATNAFGMGIDKADIRFIIHYHLPGTLEAYYQEIGRAGRDGANSRAILFYSDSDRGLQQFFIEDSKISSLKLRELMNAMKTFNFHDFLLIPHGILENSIGLNETQIRVAISQMEKLKILQRLPDLSLELIISLNPYGEDYILNETDRKFYETLLSIAGPMIEEGFFSTLKSLSEKTGLAPDILEEALLTLKYFNLINLKSVQRGIALKILPTRRQASITDVANGLVKIAEEKLGKLNSLIQYALTPVCRRHIILQYFGDNDVAKQCGFCDNCRGGSSHVELSYKASLDAIPLLPPLQLVHNIRIPVGRTRLAEILVGSKKKEILSRNFHLISDYGILNNYPLKKIKQLLLEAIRGGFMEIYYRPGDNLHRYPLLKNTDEGEKLLSEQKDVFIQLKEKQSLKTKKQLKTLSTIDEKDIKQEVILTSEKQPKKRKSSATLEKLQLNLDDEKLYNSLREWRFETAKRFRTKAFMIFSNETLKHIAHEKPKTFDALLAVKGVGSVKLADYGKQIISIIKKYLSS